MTTTTARIASSRFTDTLQQEEPLSRTGLNERGGGGGGEDGRTGKRGGEGQVGTFKVNKGIPGHGRESPEC